VSYSSTTYWKYFLAFIWKDQGRQKHQAASNSPKIWIRHIPNTNLKCYWYKKLLGKKSRKRKNKFVWKMYCYLKCIVLPFRQVPCKRNLCVWDVSSIYPCNRLRICKYRNQPRFNRLCSLTLSLLHFSNNNMSLIFFLLSYFSLSFSI
jgi:hypothetical protein